MQINVLRDGMGVLMAEEAATSPYCGNPMEAGDVLVCAMDREANLLFGEDGRTYCEVHPNLWAPRDAFACDVVYLGTSRHGSAIILKPLFVKMEHAWRNVISGRPAPSGISLP